MRQPYRIFFNFSLLMMLSGILFAGETQFSAQVDKQTVYKDQEVNLNLKISGASVSNIQAPHLPNFNGFDTFYSGRASHFMFVNGQTSSTTEFNYVLVPKATGVFTLSPIEIAVDGQTYRAEPIQIEVLGQTAQPQAPVQQPQSPQMIQPPVPSVPYASPQASPRPAQPGGAGPLSPARPEGPDENIFLRVNPNKRVVYSNEQLLLTYSLLTRYDTRYEGFQDEPETSGFWVEEFPLERDIGKQTETISGQRYVRADIRKMALFPTAPGEYVIKPGSIKASVQIEQKPSSLLDEFFNDSFFSNAGIFARRVDKNLGAPPIAVVVKPLPEEGKPKSFNGAVGEFRMNATVDKRAVNQNEPVTLQLVIEGDGNIETLSHPNVPDLPDVKIYDSDTKSDFFKVEGLVAGKKTYEIIFIPKLAGTLEIPPLEFSYFNPRIEKYITLKTENYKIDVKPSSTPAPAIPKELQNMVSSKKEIDVVGKDIRYIHEHLATANQRAKPLLWFFLLANILLTIGAVLIQIGNRQEAAIRLDAASFRNRAAKRKAKKIYAKLASLQKKGDEKSHVAFFDEAEKLMNHYLADKLNVSPHNLTLAMISEELSRRNASLDFIQRIKKFYESCGLVRYGGASAFEAGAQEVLAQINSILEEDF